MKKISRRSFLTAMAAVSAAGVLAACGADPDLYDRGADGHAEYILGVDRARTGDTHVFLPHQAVCFAAAGAADGECAAGRRLRISHFVFHRCAGDQAGACDGHRVCVHRQLE